MLNLLSHRAGATGPSATSALTAAQVCHGGGWTARALDLVSPASPSRCPRHRDHRSQQGRWLAGSIAHSTPGFESCQPLAVAGTVWFLPLFRLDPPVGFDYGQPCSGGSRARNAAPEVERSPRVRPAGPFGSQMFDPIGVTP
jgi:hypothetical protein